MWYYKGEEYNPSEEELKEWVGFIYVITDKSNNKKYLGKKQFWSKKTLPPLKGKTRKRRSVVVSDWMKYYGSSDLVKQLLAEHGADNFHREIIHFGKTKGALGYLELFEQVTRHALLDDNYYNGIVQARIHHSHVKKIDVNELERIMAENVIENANTIYPKLDIEE